MASVYRSAMGDDPPARATAAWCLVAGDESRGRYAVTRNKRHVNDQIDSFDKPAPFVPDNGRFVIEIDCQTFELRCARARVQALESDIAQNTDVAQIAGSAARTMQCRAAPDAEQMRERALCGTPWVLRSWQVWQLLLHVTNCSNILIFSLSSE